MKSTWLPLIAALSLTACQTPEQRMARFDQECQRMGFKQGTERYSDCMLQLRTQDEQREAESLKWRRERAEQAKKEMLSYGQPKKAVTCQNWGSVTKCTED